MPSLSETQAGFRAVIAGGTAPGLVARLRVPRDPVERLEIYRRHYRESFRRHLRGRYPTLEWLLGTDRIVAIADATLLQSPPRSPSLAEYGAELIDTVVQSAAELPSYLADVARLDWHLGCLSVALAHEPLALATLARVDAEQLGQLRLTLQPGLAYVSSPWPVDELVHLRQQDNAPAELAFKPQTTHLELRGARGRFALQRLAAGDFAFRSGIAAGETLATAAAAGLAAQTDFDLSTGLSTLFAEGLVINHSGGTNNV